MSDETALGKWMADNSVNDDALSKRVGVSRVQITRLRNGSNKPSPATAVKLEQITGIPAMKLILGEAADIAA